MRSLQVASLVAIVFAATYPLFAVEDSDVLFFAPYEGTAAATIARGEAAGSGPTDEGAWGTSNSTAR